MKRSVLACTLLAFSTIAQADGFPVTENAVFTFNGQEITISRASTLEQSALTAVTLTTSTCINPCLTAMIAAPDVPTFGELDVLDFLSTDVARGDGLLVDARLPQDRTGGFIPASVNIPTATLNPDNPYRNEILRALGAEEFQGIFKFTAVLSLVVYDAGPATLDAPDLILDLVAAGYPAEKLAYYRGGMMVWTSLGLTTAQAAQ